MRDFVCRLPEDIHQSLKKMSYCTNESMAMIVRKALKSYINDNSEKDVKEDCCSSQFYNCMEPVLSKIWDNPDDDIYNDM